MIVKHQHRDPVIVQVIAPVLLDGAREDPVKIQGESREDPASSFARASHVPLTSQETRRSAAENRC